MEPKRALLISWDIEEYDSITCFAIKALVADLRFWPKLVGSAAAMVKKCARNTKFYVCPDLIRLFGGGFAFITGFILRTKYRRVKRRAYFSRLSVRHRLSRFEAKIVQRLPTNKMNPAKWSWNSLDRTGGLRKCPDFSIVRTVFLVPWMCQQPFLWGSVRPDLDTF